MGLNFVAIDFETANSQRSSACSIGYAVVENGEIVKTNSLFIKPTPFYFETMNIMVHGITESDVEDSPNLIDVWDEIMEDFSDKPLVAHNASFDFSVLRAGFTAFEEPCPEHEYICTYKLAQIIWPDLQSYRLNQLCSDKLNYEFNHHDAEEDSVACAKLLLALCKEEDCDNIGDLLEKHNLSFGQTFAEDYTPFSISGKLNCSKRKYKKADLRFDYTLDFLRNKTVVLTGKFNLGLKKDLEDKIIELGGNIGKDVTKKTHLLIVGDEGFNLKQVEDGMSSKLKKAILLKESGANIQIMYEKEFLSIVTEESMLINERLSELGGAILKVHGDKYHVTGFMYPERLDDYLDKNINCFYSQGIYPLAEIDYSVLQDNATVIVIDENGNEKKTCFEVLKKDSVKYKAEDKRQLTKVYWVRKCKYSGVYNLKFTDESLLFNTLEELQDEFMRRFNVDVDLEEQLSLI